MNIKHMTLTPVAFALALGSAPALSSNGWYHDEKTDSIVFTLEGSRSGLPASENSAAMSENATRSWYYDDVRDTIVFNVEGSRSDYARSNQPGNQTPMNTRSWYYDESRDTIVFNVEGSRSDYLQQERSM